ncbi:MAG: hypothetical protein ACXVW8_04710 [Nocardioidaceae bacterium]
MVSETGTAPLSLDACLAAARSGRSASRCRQLSWVASEMGVFAGTLPARERPVAAPAWFAEAFVAGYLAAADAGTLRRRGAGALPSPDATRRSRRACLRLLAEAAGLPDPVPDSVGLPEPRPRVEDRAATLAVQHWRWRALPADARPGDVRTAAMAVLVHEAGMRSGELAALLPGDLDLDAGSVTYQPRPPSTRQLPPPRTVSLSGPAVAALRHWLRVRAELTMKTPRTKTLWVSLAANHDGSGVRRPAGMPLQPTGLRRAHARAVAQVNFFLAGTSGFDPLPRTVGPLRREPE